MSEKKGFLAGLFGGGKSGGCCNMEIVEETGCDCGEACCGETEEVKADRVETGQADILILGPGCKNCQGLERNVEEALQKMGRDIEIAHVTDFGEIAAYGIMSTPGLVVKGKVVSSGKVLKPDAIISILEKNL